MIRISRLQVLVGLAGLAIVIAIAASTKRSESVQRNSAASNWSAPEAPSLAKPPNSFPQPKKILTREEIDKGKW